jgi:heptose I phosphotransferase
VSLSAVWRRLRHGQRWSYIDPRYRDRLPTDFAESAFTLDSTDRFHAKQGRSTSRVRLDRGQGVVSGYLKRHERLPWPGRLAALLGREGRHSPAAVEWDRLEQTRALGVAVPDVIAVGESVGPGASARSFLLVAELTDQLALHEAIPHRARTDPAGFPAWKRRVVAELAALAARLHGDCFFHKDFYLCHVFIRPDGDGLTLIDLQRARRHPLTAVYWQAKDLAQLLFSTEGVAGVTDRDRLRFWAVYARRLGVNPAGVLAWLARLKARRYLRHNRAKAALP